MKQSTLFGEGHNPQNPRIVLSAHGVQRTRLARVRICQPGLQKRPSRDMLSLIRMGNNRSMAHCATRCGGLW